jgi:hypothetical protein
VDGSGAIPEESALTESTSELWRVLNVFSRDDLARVNASSNQSRSLVDHEFFRIYVLKEQ